MTAENKRECAGRQCYLPSMAKIASWITNSLWNPNNRKLSSLEKCRPLDRNSKMIADIMFPTDAENHGNDNQGPLQNRWATNTRVRIMNEANIESADGHSREHRHPHDSVGSFATVKSMDEQSIMAVEAHHKAADLFTILLGNLNMLHRQPMNEKGNGNWPGQKMLPADYAVS